MSGLIKLVIFILWAAIVPVLMGCLPVSFLPREHRSVHVLVMAGFLTCYAVFELIGLPVLLFTYVGKFVVLEVLFIICSLAVIAAGLFRLGRSGGIPWPAGVRSAGREANVLRILFLILLVFQLYKAYTTASYDGDDAYYVAQSLQTYQTGTMYHLVPYTGESTILDGRHCMAMIPMWIAFVARMSSTHPTIVTHSMLPLVFLPLAYLCMYNVVGEVFYKEGAADRRRFLWAAMVVIAVFVLFGNSSIYTAETFLLTRTWQGKTVYAAILIPAAFWILLEFAHHYEDRARRRFLYLMLVILNIASGFCTSLAPFMVMGFLVLGAILLAVLHKDRRIVRNVLLTCIPCLIYAFWLVRLMCPDYFEYYTPWFMLPSEYSAIYGVY